MKQTTFLVTLLAIGSLWLSGLGTPSAAVELKDYLPSGIEYDPQIPRPAEVLGFEPGERHVRHDQLVAYLRRLAASSERIQIQTTGHTHEGRELLLLTISSAANLARLEQLRGEHLRLSDPSVATPDTRDMPVVVNLGYSVHGNEASGANAAPVVAYHLAAAQGSEIDRLLATTIILLDPSLNPDGLARFAQWSNMHLGQVPVADPDHREHREAWPNGRTNHYWFDLNRDWLLLQHPESRARVTQFHRWRPNVLTDFHEMGSDSTYFFQPGVPRRQNPLTPAKNLELTRKIASFHAQALDRAGRLYYSEETFDDYYFGKGSTYPDLHGAIGILFEQASARGLLQATVNGPLSFPLAIHNQVLTSLSTLAAAVDLRHELLDYQAEFYRTVGRQTAGSGLAGWVFGEPADEARQHHLLELLAGHQIVFQRSQQQLEVDGQSFAAGSWVVPLDQPQGRLARALFETRLEFPDTVFYDVSTWTLPLAFDIPWAALDKRQLAAASAATSTLPSFPSGHFEPTEEAYAFAFDWSGYYAPRALYRLLRAGVRVRASSKPFEALTAAGRHQFSRGAVVVQLATQEVQRSLIIELLQQAATADALEVHSLSSGWTPQGVDLGSPSLQPLRRPRPALLVGRGVSDYEAGQAWHLLDQRFGIELPLIDTARLPQVDLQRFSHLILVDGGYSTVDEEMRAELRRWVHRGGVLIAIKQPVEWVDRQIREDPAAPSPSNANAEPSRSPSGEPATGDAETAEDPRRPWDQREQDRAEALIGGAIFEVQLDTTHPLAWGYPRDKLAVFRNHAKVWQSEPDHYATVARYSPAPLLSGYSSPQNVSRIAGTPAVTAHAVGRGVVIRLADDPNFRAYWFGTNKLFLNGLFFAPFLKAERNGDDAAQE